MKRLFAIWFAVAITASALTQNYLIGFSGSGDTAVVNSVVIENLTQGTTLIVNGTDQLQLVESLTGLILENANKDNSLRIYPNPATEYCTVEFVAIEAGFATIELYDESGKRVLHVKQKLTNGKHSFCISGLSYGIYSLRIYSSHFNYTGKLLSHLNNRGKAKIIYSGQINESLETYSLKSASNEVKMQYNTGDLLKFTGISNKYSTVVTDVPAESKTINFNFLACTDADNNDYSVVQINSQIWMAENLATTKYNNGTSIPLASENLPTPYYC